MSIDERLREILIGVEEAGESAGSADIDKAISEIKKVIAEEVKNRKVWWTDELLSKLGVKDADTKH